MFIVFNCLLFKDFGLYVGFVFQLKGLGNFNSSAASADNYVVPVYGRRMAKLLPSVTFYVKVKYEISFLKKKIELK